MKITKRQLNKIITESLGIQNKVISEAVNFRKIRKDLFALKSDPDNQELLDKITNHAAKLKAKVKAGESKFFKGRYQEAVTLLASLEELLKAPTPEKIKEKIKAVTEEPIIENPPEPAPDPKPTEPTPWNPDPDPKSDWEYQVRECIWYTRKKETTKEYKLGHASGKPLEKGGKFFNSIVALNKAYPDLVKDCNPVVKKPTPKKPDPKDPDPKPGINTEMSKKFFRTFGDYNDLRMEIIKRLNINPEKILAVTSLETAVQLVVPPSAANKIKAFFQSEETKNKLSTMANKNAYDVSNEIVTQVLNPRKINVLATAVNDMYISFCVQVGDKLAVGYLSETDLGDEINAKGQVASKGFTQPTFPATISKDLFKQSKDVQSESLSRGALYRRRYYGRY